MKNGFRQTEIGRFPVEWEITNIADAFTLQQGKSLSNREQTGEFRKPFLRTANVFWGRLNLSKVDEMDIPPKDRERLALQYGDVLVCEGGDIGRTAMWRRELSECYYQNHLHRLRRKDDRTCPEFFVLWMEAAFQFLKLYGGIGNRTTIPNLSSARLKEFKFPLPPPPEQWKIAAVLGKIQRAVELQDAILANVRELKKSMMNRLFTHGLRGETLKQTEIGEMPVSWRVGTVLSISETIADCPHSTPRFTDDGKRVIRNYNIRDGRLLSHPAFFTSEEEYQYRVKRCAPRAGDILFSREAPVGEACVIPPSSVCCMGQRMMLIRTRPELANPFFVVSQFYFDGVRSRLLKKSSGVTAPHVNVGDIKAFEVMLPDISEQGEIAHILQTLDEKLAVHESKKAAVQDLFKTTLNQLMTGAVRVADLDIDTSEVEAA